MKTQAGSRRKAEKRVGRKTAARLIGVLPLPRELKKYNAVTYLAGPMQAARWNGVGWRNRLASALLKRFGIYALDPVSLEKKKTGLNATRTKQLIKKLTILIIKYHDKDAEQKFMKIMNRIVSSDLEMVARANFMIAKMEEGIVSGGTTTEMIDGARAIYWRRKFMPKNKPKSVYVLYAGKPESFSAWLLYFVILSGGRVFLTDRNNGHKEFLNYLQKRYELECEENKNR